MDYRKECERWYKKGIMRKEIEALTEQDKEECFCRELEFGTGGIRAVMGPGPNRLNIYTIRKNTEGYARYIKDKGGASVVIAFDNRHHSKEFAEETAKVLSGHGIAVFLFENLRPTPELSFAVRHLRAFGGVVITASHNPPEYNGYKIYDSHGCQCVPEVTDEIIRYIRHAGDALEINTAENASLIQEIGEEVDAAYYEALLSVQERPDEKKTLSIVYTPLHGTGHIPVMTMLKRLGYDIAEVEEQAAADGSFRNAESPNPEDKRSFKRAISIAKKKDADIILATDPDCDRIGVAVKDGDDYEYLTGNCTGAILLQYLLSAKKEKGALPDNGIVLNTIVTSDLGMRICEAFGVETESTLTGFKFIGDKIREYGGRKTFLFGYEESYGYMIKDFTRDKDGVQAAIIVAEAANYYKNRGKTLIDALNAIYEQYGYCEDVQESSCFPGIAGEKKMQEIIDAYREGGFGEEEGRRIIAKEDYLLGIRTECDGVRTALPLPKSNVIKLFLEDGSWVVIRPSGNEPKLKRYKNLWAKRN